MKVSVLILTSMLATVTTQIAASPISISTYLDPSTSSISSSLSSSFTFLSSLLSPRLIQTSSDSSPFWSIELHKSYLLYRNTHFIDLTDNQQLGQLSQSRIASSPPSFPDKPAYKDQVEHLLKQVSEKGPRANLEEFTAFYNRYYKSDYGKQSQKWLLNTLNKVSGWLEKSSKQHSLDSIWMEIGWISDVEGPTSRSQSHPWTLRLFLPSTLFFIDYLFLFHREHHPQRILSSLGTELYHPPHSGIRQKAEQRERSHHLGSSSRFDCLQ